MDDDNEFGDLYADILPPAQAPPPPSLASAAAGAAPSTTSKPPASSSLLPRPRSENSNGGGHYRDLFGSPGSGKPPSPRTPQLPVQSVVEGRVEDLTLGPAPAPEKEPSVWSDREDDGLLRVSSVPAADLLPPRGVVGALLGEEEEGGARVGVTPHEDAGEDEEGTGAAEGGGTSLIGREAVAALDVGNGPADFDQEPVIPGLSVASAPPGALHGAEDGDVKVTRSDDGDSDSEDDLQIVLNNDDVGMAGGSRNAGVGVEDEDGEDDLIVVADEDQHRHNSRHQDMEELNWDGESMQQPSDGERKETPDATSGNSEIGPVAVAKIGYSNHGYNGQHHPQFKYIRPGAAAIQGGAAAGIGHASGQVCPPLTMSPMAGRGRGVPKSFHSGYGLLVWSSGTSARAYSSGLEFTLPSHKTIFDINIDDLGEKPWRLPGVDISNFFNFGLDEERWRDFCKQLEQVRHKATMQSKICVYESGRSERDYDRDLPPKFATATHLQDISVGSAQYRKVDGEQADLLGHEKGALCSGAQMPIGRAIQVESGFGERLPSIDTRPPRMRDSDAIIEIVLQGSIDVGSGTLDGLLCELPRQDVEGDHVHDDKRVDSEYIDHFPSTCSARQRDGMKRKGFPMGSNYNNTREGNGVLPLPPDASSECLTISNSQSPVIAGGCYDAPCTARLTQSSTSAECSNDSIASQSVRLQVDDDQKEGSGYSMEGKGILQSSPTASVETAAEVKSGQRSDEQNDRAGLDAGAEIEKEETASDLQLSGKCDGDNGSYHAVKKQKLSSLVEQHAAQDKDDLDDSRAIHSDSSRAKSGISKDYLKRHEGGEEELIQGRQMRQIGDLNGHHHEKKQSYQPRDDHGRDGGHGMDRSHATSKERKDVYQSHLHREWDSTNRGHRSKGFERGKKRDDSLGHCLRREDDAHCIKGKYEDNKQDDDDLIGSRHRSKPRVSERKGKDEVTHLRKHIADSDRIGDHDRDGARRKRDRDDILTTRHENVDDLHSKRRKGEEKPRREEVAEEDTLHGWKSRGGAHSKHRRDDGANHKSMEDQTSVRGKVGDHCTKNCNDNTRHRERENRRLNKLNEDMHINKKREEGHTMVKGKHMGGIGRVNNLSKGLGSEDYPPRDRRQQSEQHKKGNNVEEHAHAQHKAQKNIRPHESQLTDRGKNSKNERFGSHNSCPLAASDSQQVSRGRHRESSRKSKENKWDEKRCQATEKITHEDQSCHPNEKVGVKGTNKAGINMSCGFLSKEGHHLTGEIPDVQEQHQFSGKHTEDDVVSDDDRIQNIRRGRSKLERWTNHAEDYSNNSPQPFSSSMARELGVSNFDITQLGESFNTEGNNVDLDAKDAGITQVHTTEEEDCCIDTVAELKQQNDQFKHPMLGMDTILTKKPENDVPPIENVTVVDAESKQE